jgi:TPR repeat protein
VNQDRQAILPHQHLDPMLPDRARSTQPVAAHEGPGSCSTVDEQAVRWTRNAAEQGYAAAQIALGDIYSEGRGVPQDQARALVWYRKAAEQGIAEAHRKVALMCANGQGVPQDHAQAVRWTRRHLEMKSDPA